MREQIMEILNQQDSKLSKSVELEELIYVEAEKRNVLHRVLLWVVVVVLSMGLGMTLTISLVSTYQLYAYKDLNLETNNKFLDCELEKLKLENRL